MTDRSGARRGQQWERDEGTKPAPVGLSPGELLRAVAAMAHVCSRAARLLTVCEVEGQAQHAPAAGGTGLPGSDGHEAAVEALVPGAQAAADLPGRHLEQPL